VLETLLDTSRQIDWESLIPESEWNLYKPAIDNFRASNIRFAIGGGLAFSEYAHRVRNTKDLDLYIYPWQKDDAIEQLLAAGFKDYFDQKPYDRSWIFRGHQGNVIVDLIWTSPNHRMQVDAPWLSRGRDVVVYGMRMPLIPPEELIWAKLYVVQHDRNDWTDLLNMLDVVGPTLNWRHLLDRVGVDALLLGGLLSVYRWVSPQKSKLLPPWVWEKAGLCVELVDRSGEAAEFRAALLDSRDWFGPKETLEAAS
jgi:hypothetical protein